MASLSVKRSIEGTFQQLPSQSHMSVYRGSLYNETNGIGNEVLSTIVNAYRTIFLFVYLYVRFIHHTNVCRSFFLTFKISLKTICLPDKLKDS